MIPLQTNYITIFPFNQHISMIFFRLVKVNEIDFKQCDAFKTHVCTQHSSNRNEKFTMNVCIPLWSDALLFCSLKALSTVARQRGKHNHTKSNELMALENACAVWLKWLEEWSVVGFGLLDIGCSGCFSHVFAMHSKIRYYLRIWYDLCWIWEDVEREISPTVCCS